jgi:hypothetical protein
MLVNKELQPYFKAAALLGVLLLIGDTLLSAKFGWTISTEAMFIVGAISLASGILPVIAWFFLRADHKGVAYSLLVAWAVFAFPFNVYSNMGVSTANRMGEVQKAGLQQTTYNERQKSVAESEAKLELFTKQLNSLLEQNAWAASVSADGLRSEAATLQAVVDAESRKSNGGCKRKCLTAMEKKREVERQIGVAEQRTDLTKQIEATKTVLAKAREDLANTDGGVSITANQASLYAKVVNWDLGGDPDQRSIDVANEVTGIILAVVLAVLAAATTLAGAYPALMKVGKINVNAREVTVGDDEPRAMTETAREVSTVMGSIKAKGSELVSQGRDTIREVVKVDDGLRASIQRRLDEINARPRRGYA